MKDIANLRPIVCETIRQVLQDSGREAGDISADDTLREGLQLDSLDLAVVVVRLEQCLGVDPFRQHRQPVHTVRDLIRAYETELHPRE